LGEIYALNKWRLLSIISIATEVIGKIEACEKATTYSRLQKIKASNLTLIVQI
jgi:hypothetical protein